MAKETKKVPTSALCLEDPENSVQAFAESDGDEEPRIRMTAYSGAVIKDHWYWGDLVLNVAGMKKASPTIPILQDHFTSQKIGFTRKVLTDDNKVVFDPKSSKLVSTPYAEEFVKLSKEGFPFQCSVYARPTKIVELAEGESQEVNGFKFSGPGTIFDKWTLKEGSVCTFGYDSKTSATAFSEGQVEELELEVDVPVTSSEDAAMFAKNLLDQKGGEEGMDLEKLKAEYPELYKAILAEGVAQAEAQFSQERDGFTQTIDGLRTQLSDQGERIAKMEKQTALDKEAAALANADRLFAEAFAESDVPDRWKGKVRNQVNHQKFVNDDGDLDEKGFSEAVEAELKDWEEKGATSSVSGFAQAVEDDTEGDETPLAEENKEVAKDLLARAGQKE